MKFFLQVAIASTLLLASAGGQAGELQQNFTVAAAQAEPAPALRKRDTNIQLADQCGNTKQSCNDPAFPRCNFNPTRSEYYCCARSAVFCAAQARSYCCPAGSRCNGNGSGPPYCITN
jgi:hypothetical protein